MDLPLSTLVALTLALAEFALDAGDSFFFFN